MGIVGVVLMNPVFWHNNFEISSSIKHLVIVFR